MRPLRFCAPKWAHFALLLSILAVFLLSLQSSAHTIVLSEYTLQYQNEGWTLSFHKKTNQLRDAIYSSRPDLKGINLNSKDFKAATFDYITSNLSLAYQGDQLRIIPQNMHYGGLRFESTFLVEGLAEEPDFLGIKVNGFDGHEHSIVLFRIAIEKEGYLNYFNEHQRVATFDFTSHHYAFEEMKSDQSPKSAFYTMLFVVFTGVVVWLFPGKRLIGKSMQAQVT